MIEAPRSLEQYDQLSVQFGSIIFRKEDPLRTTPIVVIEPATESQMYILGNHITNPFEDEPEILFMRPESLLENHVDQVFAHLDLDQMRAAWRRGLENVELFTPKAIEKTYMRQFELYAQEMLDREQVIRSGPFRRPTR